MPNCTVNGVTYAFNAGETISVLLEKMNLQNKKVAVEQNGTIVPKSCHAESPLAIADVIEIVTAVGGG